MMIVRLLQNVKAAAIASIQPAKTMTAKRASLTPYCDMRTPMATASRQAGAKSAW